MRGSLVVLVFLLILQLGQMAVDLPSPSDPQANKPPMVTDESFFVAARQGDVVTVKNMLAQGVLASSKDAKGNTALIIASGRGQTEVLKVLLAQGADPNEETAEGLFEGKTALCWAASQGRTNAAALLIQNGANPSLPMLRGVFAGKTPLMWASSQGRTEVVKLLLSAGAEVDYSSDSGAFRGKNSLMWASSQGRVDTVAALLMHGSNVNAVDSDNISALMWASGSETADDGHKKGLLEKATKGHIDVINLLLKYGALVDLQDKDGITAVMYASFNGHSGAVQALINAGADTSLRNNAGRTALQLALNTGDKESSAVILAGPSILSLQLSNLLQVSSCGWLLSLLRAPASSSMTCGAGVDKDGSITCPKYNYASSCQELQRNGLGHNVGDLLYIVRESSVAEVVKHLGLPNFASKVRATAQLKEMFRRFSHHYEDLHSGSEVQVDQN